MSNWTSFVNRVKQECGSVLKNNKGGFAIVTMHVLVNHNGDPIAWVVDDAKRIEPSSGVAEVIKSIAGNTTH